MADKARPFRSNAPLTSARPPRDSGCPNCAGRVPHRRNERHLCLQVTFARAQEAQLALSVLEVVG